MADDDRADPAGPSLADLDEAARYARFDDLQARMPSVWVSMRRDAPDESVVVVPSVSLDRATETNAALNQAMEERSLFLLLLLRQPRLRMIYVTSMPVPEEIIEYYLALLPGVIPSHARARLTMVAVGDSTPRSLSTKVLERPGMLRAIGALIPNRARCHLIAYNATTLERDVAISLGIPMYGADPRLGPLGGKTGCRRLFDEVGVAHPLGVEDLHGLAEVVSAIAGMRRRRPELGQVIVKLNDGVSGAGNALVDLRGLPTPGDPGEAAAIDDRVRAMQLESDTTPFDAYVAKFEEGGGIVEERITGEEILSPSVQLRVLPDRTVELLSTHDQLLGGQSGQSYLGCIFPASPDYAALITEPAVAIGERLAELGVLGRFAVDFVVVRDATGAWTPYAIELNLRKGGTTHPYLTLQFLTGGAYDRRSGQFLTPSGEAKHLVATDHLEDPSLQALRLPDLFEIIALHGLHFDPARQAGVVLHMLSCLTELGRIGLTAVGDTPEQAWAHYERARTILLDEARRALAPPALPG